MNLRIDCPPTHRESPITFCGEAPGQDEVWKRQGFVGKSGQLLETICNIGGLDFNNCNLTNVVKRHPHNNNFGEFYEDKTRTKPTQEYLAWRAELVKELQQHRPRVLVAVGGEAIRALCGDLTGGVLAVRGSTYDCALVPGIPVVALQHPAQILYSRSFQDVYVCGRIVRKTILPLSRPGGVAERLYTYDVGRDIRRISDFVHACVADRSRWVIDIETRGRGIACVGIGRATNGYDQEETLVVPIETSNGPHFSLAAEHEFWQLLQYLSDHNPYLILQNSPFDIEWMMDYGFVPAHLFMDTMTAHHLLYAELPKKLQFLNFFYSTGLPYYKDEGHTWGKRDPDERLYAYCAKDLVCELRVSFAEEEELKETDRWTYYHEHTLPATELAIEMQRRGFPVDGKERRWAKGVVLREWKAAHDRLTKAVGHDVNIRSSVDAPDLLYKELGFPKLYGKSNADEDVLVSLKTWLAGQKPKKHTRYCNFGKKPCKHKTQAMLDHMAVGLECLQRERKLLKAESGYLADKLYTELPEEWQI